MARGRSMSPAVGRMVTPVRVPVEGAAGAPFSPDNLANLQLWLEADAITGLSDGDPVSTWLDSSAAGNDVTQSGTARPTYKTNIINGLPVVRFDGVDDYMHVASALGITTASTVVVVVNIASSSRAGSAIKIGDSGISNPDDDGWSLGVGANTHDAAGNEVLGLYEQVAWIDTNAAWGLGLVVVVMTVNGSDPDFYKDRVNLGFGTSSAPRSPGANTYIGGGAAPVAGGGIARFWDDDIAEVLIYSRVLTPTERADIEDYLFAKYALAWDDFDDANGTNLSGKADDLGNTWSVNAGTFDIQSGEARVTSAGFALATIDAATADVDVTLKAKITSAAGEYIIVRWVDASNFIFLLINSAGAAYQLYKKVGGVNTLLGSGGSTPAAGTQVTARVTVSGSNYEVFADGASLFTATDAAHSTATKHGIAGDSSSAGRMDHLVVMAKA